jgi:hypothetical protein
MKRLRDPIEADSPVMKCSLCEDCGWVCETHPGRPWEGDHACACGGAGAPCPWCNMPDEDGRRGCRIASRQTLTKKAGDISARGWKRPFEDPIPLPRGRQLVTLQDAGNYITKLPKTEHEAPEWQAAMEALMLVATLGGPTMFARIGVMRALNRHIERLFNPSREDPHWRKRKLARDR